MEKACGAIDIERSTTTSEANIFLAVLMIIPFRGRKRRLIVVTNIVSSNRTWTTTLSLEKSSRVVPEFLRTLVFARPRGDDQFADCTFSPSLDMSR